MNNDDLLREIEDLKADLRQQHRLVKGLQRQVATLLNEIAKRDEKKNPKREKKRDKKKRRDKAASEKVAPKAPSRTE